jgi:hypothetical protein
MLNNNQLLIALVFVMLLFFGCQALIEGTNLRTIVNTCKEAK